MKAPNYAPMYCALYPDLADVARAHGYALAVHGTLGRDMDLVCVPWSDSPSKPVEVVAAITTKFSIRTVGEPEVKAHGREVWTISVGFGECFIDLSFLRRDVTAEAFVRMADLLRRVASARHWAEEGQAWGYLIDEATHDQLSALLTPNVEGEARLPANRTTK